jgi:ubiquinone/menaquinone biosynthesis C-methylase UbiE
LTPEIKTSFHGESKQRYRRERTSCWDRVAQKQRQDRTDAGAYYHRYIKKVYRFLVPEKLRVLELGCGSGDLLASLKPSHGMGVDFSSEMLASARQCHPELTFIESDVHDIDDPEVIGQLGDPFDIIILSDLINDLFDVYEVLSKLQLLCSSHTRMLINFHSHLWEHPIQIAQRLGLSAVRLQQNWFTPADVKNLLDLTGFELVCSFDEFLWPLDMPLFAPLCNRYLAKLWPFSLLALVHFLVCRPLRHDDSPQKVSVVIPARNEAGNIEAALESIPEMGAGTELIFVEGGSDDNTWEAIQEAIARHPNRPCKAIKQQGIGKGDAVRAGFDLAEGDILMILDADLAVPPESLLQFYEAIASGKGDFINGVRLIYPKEKEAMRFFNLIGNKCFSLAFSWLLNRNIKDTLCGTKVLSRKNYLKITANRGYFGEFDPFGDFDLLFGAAKLNLKIVDLPVRYRERTYGQTNISRWKHGLMLLRMVLFAAKRIKFF